MRQILPQLPKFRFIPVFFFLFFLTASFAQKTVITDDATYTGDPSAMLDVYSTTKGLLAPRGASHPLLPATGLVYYNTTSNCYWMYDGTSWREISYGQLWVRSAPTKIHNNPRADSVGIGVTFPQYPLHIVATFLGNATQFPQVAIDNPNPAGNASMIFRNVSMPLFFGYTMGMDFGEGGTFKLVKGQQVNTPTGLHGDGVTMWRARPSGIFDLNNQSRIRAWQDRNPHLPMPTTYGQPVPFAQWTPVYFDQMTYDQQGEMTLMTVPLIVPPFPPLSFFQAAEDGYYQVNARVDFAYAAYTFDGDLPQVTPIFGPPIPGGFVSIGIVKNPAAGAAGTMYTQGNKLQAFHMLSNPDGSEYLQNNLAPNVKDVLWLKRGEKVEIHVWQSIYQGMIPLRIESFMPLPIPIPSHVYVSIHKVS